MEKFEIKKILNKEIFEQLGTKEKFWYDNNRFLFKIGRDNTLENCSEKIAYEIAKIIGLPCAEYELGSYNNKQGSVSKNFLIKDNENYHLILGNEMLAKVVKNYPKDKRFKAREYKLNLVLEIFDIFSKNNVLSPIQDKTPLFVFLGYLIFDCLIGNQDRHHENWGVIVNGDIILAPTFDHASGVASKVSEAEAKRRLTTKDKNQSIEHYCNKATTPFYDEEGKILKTIEVVKKGIDFSTEAKESCLYWIDKILEIEISQYKEVLDKIPLEFILQENQRRFILEMLRMNTQRLKETRECLS
ncbi:HipA-like C-terminal domain-containing protein [Helicobacter ganmani]|uniref:HipA domain-containing protein n=1 Tax=Helicobacter ganmani TaxID=60246 RepID=UPI0039ECA9B7